MWLNEHVQRLLRFGERHRVLVDLAIAVGTAAVSLVGLSTQDRLGPLNIVFCLALCVPLPSLRRSPSASFTVIAVVAFAQWVLAAPQLADVAVLFALYFVALEAAVARTAVAVVTVEIGAVLAAIRWSPSDPVKIWIGLSGLTVAAGFLGITVRQRRALLVSLQERAARLELERDQEGRLGAVAERARIAREMHDIVSHNLTVMIALADGATYAMGSSPERALPAIETVSATGRQALVEMRRLLGMLRDEPGEHPLEPQPGLDRLDDLLARVDAAGIPVSMEIDGDPRRLSDGVQLAVFRVAQEALTNILKHASRPARARLLLSCRSGQVELEVIDAAQDGLIDRDDHAALNVIPRAVAGGRGLRGMRERAAVYGGVLEAGPLPAGGWRVHLLLRSDSGGRTG